MNIKSIVISLVLFIIATFFLYRMNAGHKNELDSLKKEIIAKDVQKKIADGKFSKLVNTYAKEKGLNEQLKKENKLLYDTIKARGEKILSITSAFISFKNKTGSKTPLIPLTDTTLSFTSYYPEKTDYFIKYQGVANTKSKTVLENWEFEKFKLGVILTERKDGLWDAYIDVPEYAEVSGIKINSLPPEKYSPESKKVNPLNLYGGFGYTTNLSNVNIKNIYIQGGVGLKGKAFVLGQLNTDKTAGLGLLFKF